jgi:hypothetical protein
MKQRTENKNSPSYQNYGGRGINICEEWSKSFDVFLHDMGEKPAGLSIDRIDNEKGYFKENCRWTTGAEQAHNKRNNNKLTYGGETLTLAEWSRRIGINVKTLEYRYYQAHWPIDKILATPAKVPKIKLPKHITYAGDTLSVTEWARKLNLNPSTLEYRLRRGWTIKEALK